MADGGTDGAEVIASTDRTSADPPVPTPLTGGGGRAQAQPNEADQQHETTKTHQDQKT
jgi:hypothetical protein